MSTRTFRNKRVSPNPTDIYSYLSRIELYIVRSSTNYCSSSTSDLSIRLPQLLSQKCSKIIREVRLSRFEVKKIGATLSIGRSAEQGKISLSRIYALYFDVFY